MLFCSLGGLPISMENGQRSSEKKGSPLIQMHTSEPFLIHENSEYQEEEEENELLPSFEELRNDMISRLDAPNFRNKIRSQIRSTLALHLAPQNVLTAKSSHVLPDPLRELANAIVAQHLLSSCCEFTLSVFLPEAMLNPEVHPMSLSSLLIYLRVQYPEFEKLESSNNRSLLSLLVSYLPVSPESIASRFSDALRFQNILKYHTGSQTDTEADDMLKARTRNRFVDYRKLTTRPGLVTGDRQTFLDEIDHEDVELANKFRTVLDLDEIKYQLDLKGEDELASPQQIAAAFRKFKKSIESEVTEMVSKAKDDEFRTQLDIEKERAFKERSLLQQSFDDQIKNYSLLSSKSQDEVKEIQRKIQSDQAVLNTREDELTRRERLFEEENERKRKLTEEKEKDLLNQAKKLADLTEVLQARENSIQNTINAKVGELIHIQSEHLEDREQKLKREEVVLNKLKDQLTRSIVADNVDPTAFLSSPALEPKPFLQKIKSEFSRLHRENQKLKARLSGSEDKEKESRSVEELERKVRNLKTELSYARAELARERQERAEAVSDAAEKQSRYEREANSLRKECEIIKEKWVLDSARWETEKERLKTLIKDKGRKVELLKQQLREKDDKISNLESKLARLQGISSQANWIMSQQSTAGNSAYLSTPNRISRAPPDHHSSSDESALSLKSIVDAKERIRALEKEASTMQQQFSQYRRLVTDQFSSGHEPVTNVEPAKKLLLTQYLIQEKPRPSVLHETSATLSYSPPFGRGLSGGDLGKKVRSLQLEMAEAHNSDNL